MEESDAVKMIIIVKTVAVVVVVAVEIRISFGEFREVPVLFCEDALSVCKGKKGSGNANNDGGGTTLISTYQSVVLLLVLVYLQLVLVDRLLQLAVTLAPPPIDFCTLMFDFHPFFGLAL